MENKYNLAENINIKKALDFAFEAHKEGKRKGTDVPYIVHLHDVMKFLMYEEAPEHVVIAGILHDVLEDTDKTKEDLAQFGDEVLKLIEFCSEKGNTIDATNQTETWRERKEHSINQLPNATREQVLVFVADKLSNVTTIRDDLTFIGEDLWKRFNRGKDQQKWYYESILANVSILNGTRMYTLFKKAVQDVFMKQYDKIKADVDDELYLLMKRIELKYSLSWEEARNKTNQAVRELLS